MADPIKTPEEILALVESERLPRPNLDVPFVRARTELENALEVSWKEVLRLDEIGIHDNFFEIGGDSLRFFLIASRLLERLGVEVSFERFIANPTIASLALSIEENVGPSRPFQNPT